MTVLWAVILFGILIFFHELGHFIFAKLVGVKVLKFSLGFGPKLIGRKFGETEYVISAIPLGGYVKPLGEDPKEELPEDEKPRAFNNQSVWKRILIVFAGPAFNLILAYIIFVIALSVNVPLVIPNLSAINTTIEYIQEDSPGMKAGLKKKDTIVSINGRDVNTWVEIDEKLMENPGKEVALGVKRDGNLITINVVPEPVTVKDHEGKEIVVGRIGISKTSNMIGDVRENSPAMKAGLKRDDSVVSVNDIPVTNWKEMADILKKNPGKEVALGVKRDGNLIAVKVTPESVKTRDQEGNEIIIGRIGISGKLDVQIIQSSSVLYAPLKGLEAVYRWCVLTLQVVGKLFTGTVSAKQVGGPILIVDAAAKAASVGISTYFIFIAVISINLAILNLFPVPVLDGGHLMFLSVEALRGRPLSDTVMNIMNKVGLTLLMILIAFVFYNDIERIVIPWVQNTFN